MGPLPRRTTLGIDLSIGSFQEHVAAIINLGAEHRSSYVCCVNAHMCVEADRDPSFKAVVNGADLATADGMPMLKAVNTFHKVGQERVAGNDLLPALFAAAERRGLSVFLYGGRQEVLDTMVANAAREYPALRIAGTLSPPFRPLNAAEMDEHARTINGKGAHIVMVSLGCPKQERWMAGMKGKVQGVMLGLGGAFLLYAGVDTRAPKWMRDLSLEWVYRLALEPRRLFKRYLVTNSLFVGLFLRARFGRG
ncbi:MAG TPA: WecB/TagA/CpsF family glycosyltransferase [Flavobacteriales bacterium]